MSTTVKQVTKSKHVLTRTWNDIDPKVRAALGVTVADALVAVPSFLLGAISLHGLIAALLPLIVADIAAYVTTSTHRDLIVKSIGQVAADAAILGPELAAAQPVTGPAVQVVEDGLGLLEHALAPETVPVDPAGAIAPTTAIPTLPAPVAAQ